MGISYKPLWITLVERDMKKSDLYDILSSATVSRMAKDATKISLESIEKICEKLDCRVEDVIKYIPSKEEK